MENQVKEKKPFSVKEFFKSTSFKCIAVLLVIVLVCGILLTICNSLFAISPEEELNRVLGKIYPDGKVEEIIYNEDHATDKTTTFDNGEIEAAYKMDDGNYLISSAGNGGYGGAVTCWVVIEMADNKIDGIGTVAISKAPGETFLSRITADDLKYFSENYTDGEEFVATDYSDNTAGTGATAPYTRNGITNSVNTALEFVRSQILGEVTEPDPFEAFSNTKYIDTKNTTVALAEDGTSVIFHITTTPFSPAKAFAIDVTVGADGKISAYKIVTNGSSPASYADKMLASIKDGTLFIGKGADELLALLGGADSDFTSASVDESITTGATRSNTLCVYAALFASSNYTNGLTMALENSVVNTKYIDLENTTYAVDGKNVTYKIVTTTFAPAKAFTIEITVGEGGKITAYKIDTNGSSPASYADKMLASIKDGTLFVGKGADELLALLGGADSDFTSASVDASITTGATRSNTLCVYAALFATSNYETYIRLAEVTPPAFQYTLYIDTDKTTYTVDNGVVNYTIVTTKYAPAKEFTINITVGSDKKISKFEIVTNGSSPASYADKMLASIKDGTLFTGKGESELLALLGGADSDFTAANVDSSISTGATRSNILCVYAALYATANYDLTGGAQE